MKKLPKPPNKMPGPPGEPPLPGPWDEDDSIQDSIYFWHEVMSWAERGQYKPLIAVLRDSETPIGPNDRWVRDFLADVLAGKKRGRKRPPSLPRNKELVRDFDGKWEWLPKRKDRLYAAALWVKQNHKTSDADLQSAAKDFDLHWRTLVTWLRRGKPDRIDGRMSHDEANAEAAKMFKL